MIVVHLQFLECSSDTEILLLHHKEKQKQNSENIFWDKDKCLSLNVKRFISFHI